jgi:hypothetical protein
LNPDPDPLRLVVGRVCMPPSFSALSFCLGAVTVKVRVLGCERASMGALW